MKHLLMKICGEVGKEDLITTTLENACLDAKCEICAKVIKRFKPQGFTEVIVISESHASVHTWPEDNYAMVDYFTCAAKPNIDDFINRWIKSGFAIISKQLIDR